MNINLEKELKTIKLGDNNYPKRLIEIDSPPKALYCLGDTELLNKRSIGIVGSRKSSEYGRTVAHKIGKVAAENDIVVISGMAAGIDTSGHLGSLKGAGKTIAVLGTGVDVPYPRGNEGLYEEILRTGLVISEFEPGYMGAPFSFPMRNRIIAGLSDGLIVVEAGTHSGALITAEFANSMGKQVFSVPGNINNPYSIGTNKLIRDGATPIAVIDDVFSDLGFKLKLSKEEKELLGGDEEKILNLIKEKGEITIDDIAKELEIMPSRATGLITVMEMKGIIAYEYGKIFIAKL